MAKKNKGPIILVAVIVIVLMFFGIFGAMIKGSGNRSSLKGGFSFSNYIGVVTVNGTISRTSDNSILGSNAYDHKYVLESIKEAKEDSNNRGLLIRIDTPGGEVYAIHEVYEAILDYKNTTGRPVFAVMESMAASGGYYIAAACDRIYASELTWTGSIGVTMGNMYDVSGFLKKHGIKVQTLAMGRNKAMGGYTKPMTKEQKEIFYSLLKDSYDRFVSVVQKGRGFTKEKALSVADGRIFTAKQAKNLKLIDYYGSIKDAANQMILENGFDSDTEISEFEPEEKSVWDIITESAVNFMRKDEKIVELKAIMEMLDYNALQITYMAPIRR